MAYLLDRGSHPVNTIQAKYQRGEEALLTQAQAFTFLVRDQCLGVNVGSTQYLVLVNFSCVPRLERSFLEEKLCDFQQACLLLIYEKPFITLTKKANLDYVIKMLLKTFEFEKK